MDKSEAKENPITGIVTESGDTKNETNYAICKLEISETDLPRYIEHFNRKSLPDDLYKKVEKNAKFFLRSDRYPRLYNLPELNLRRIVIMHAIAAAIVLPIGHYLRQTNGPEMCSMMEQGKSLQDGRYKYTYSPPSFNPETRTPANMIQECREDFGIVISEEMAKKSYNATFKEEKADESK